MRTSLPHARQGDWRPETGVTEYRSGLGSLGLSSSRPGTTLVELLIFLAIMSLVVSLTLPMMFRASENRLLQQTVSVVEQNGAQAVQNMGLKIRNAEKILYPAAGQEGAYLMLQTGSGGTTPTIIGVLSGSVVIIQRASKETITNEQVGVDAFKVRNTSTSDESQSASVSFLVTRTIRLQQPHSYTQRFETTFGLLPDHERAAACNCPPSACLNGTSFQWYMCNNGVCEEATTALECA